jgi:hypothetical protein
MRQPLICPSIYAAAPRKGSIRSRGRNILIADSELHEGDGMFDTDDGIVQILHCRFRSLAHVGIFQIRRYARECILFIRSYPTSSINEPRSRINMRTCSLLLTSICLSLSRLSNAVCWGWRIH